MQSPLLPEKYETICREIRRRMPSYCRWTWDDRFHVALIVIDQKGTEAVFSAVINCFVRQWDRRTIAEASVKVRNLLASLFEVKPGQVVFTSDEGVNSDAGRIVALGKREGYIAQGGDFFMRGRAFQRRKRQESIDGVVWNRGVMKIAFPS